MGCSHSLGGSSADASPDVCDSGQLRVRAEQADYNRGGTDGYYGMRQNLEAKVVLLGDSGVGKSSLALRFCQGRFSPFHEVTIGAAFLQQTVRLRDGNQLKLHIWDTGGQERFRAMAPLYYRDAAGAIIVYDCSHAPSFESVKFWTHELGQKGPPNCSVVVAANKCDLPDLQLIDRATIEEVCRPEEMPHVQCSAKSGDNVGILFESLALRIYSTLLSQTPPSYR
eukprot:GHVQ01026332.1.p1 GENE.GHVQ01026332.1~~GHVQ01026332.1.p1  ORF type:complete len:225 (-),score=29.10 GHVQ01026332.1:363-1037(-)